MIDILDVSASAWGICQRRAEVVGATPQQVVRAIAAAYAFHGAGGASLRVFGCMEVESTRGVLRIRTLKGGGSTILKSA